MTPNPLPDDTLARIKELLAKATPQNIDTAETKDDGYCECPMCMGSGNAECVTYTNYDDCANGVQFFGVGPEHVSAEELFRTLLKEIRPLISRLEAAEERAERAEAAAFNEALLTRDLMAKLEAAEARAAAAEAESEKLRSALSIILSYDDRDVSGNDAEHMIFIARAALRTNPKDTEGEQ